MRKSLVVGNWKMNLTPCEAEALAGALIEPTVSLDTVDIVICPSFVFLTDVVRKVTGTHIHVGVQNVSWEEKGAFTGEVSPQMIDSLAEYVIVGHSERREKLGETDGMVNWKVLNVLKHNLVPILCVGENLKTREAGETEKHIRTQLEEGLRTVDEFQISDVVIAYEPIWAIGTGKSASSPEANDGCAFIRKVLSALYGDTVANSQRVLYGGSVNAGNAPALFKGADIDGFLVGAASLQVEEFVGICKATIGKVS